MEDRSQSGVAQQVAKRKRQASDVEAPAARWKEPRNDQDSVDSIQDHSSGQPFSASKFRSGKPQVATTSLEAIENYYRHLYLEEIDFRALGEQDESFNNVLKNNAHVDFSDPASVMQLTKILLKLDYDLLIDLPPDRLCPPVPNRHNYILWLKELIDTSDFKYSDSYDPLRKVIGLDIGTGASAIYPLLGCTQRPSWSFIATDIDAESLHYARENVQRNNLQDQIKVVERKATDTLIPINELHVENIDFVMTNPPFYSSEMELIQLAKQKNQPPNTACTGAPNEMVCDGGEVGFVQRIIEDSLMLKNRVQWYTSMLGKLSSLEAIVSEFHKHSIKNYAITEFIQGHKTRRWAVGWSFNDRRPSTRACRGLDNAAVRKLLPPLTEVSLPSKVGDTNKVKELLLNMVGSLDLQAWDWDSGHSRGVGFAEANVWSRAYRRKKLREQGSNDHAVVSAPNEAGDGPLAKRLPSIQDMERSVFGFAVSVMEAGGESTAGDQIIVNVRWLQGTDYSLFESFAGVIRKLV